MPFVHRTRIPRTSQQSRADSPYGAGPCSIPIIRGRVRPVNAKGGTGSDRAKTASGSRTREKGHRDPRRQRCAYAPRGAARLPGIGPAQAAVAEGIPLGLSRRRFGEGWHVRTRLSVSSAANRSRVHVPSMAGLDGAVNMIRTQILDRIQKTPGRPDTDRATLILGDDLSGSGAHISVKALMGWGIKPNSKQQTRSDVAILRPGLTIAALSCIHHRRKAVAGPQSKFGDTDGSLAGERTMSNATPPLSQFLV